MGLYLLAYSGSSYSGFYLRIVHLLPRFYMSTFSSILSPLKVILTIATIDTASSLQDSAYIKAAVLTVPGLITNKATSNIRITGAWTPSGFVPRVPARAKSI